MNTACSRDEARLETNLPPLSSATLIHPLRSVTERLDVETMLPIRQPLEVELGSGDGSFLARYAALHPERNFLGVERLLGRLRKLDHKGLRAGLSNLRLIRIEAAYFLEYLMHRGATRALHIYFPDPWPQRRHRRNRLINEAFTETTGRVLEPGGRVYLRTDDRDYFEQMTTVFAANPTFRAVETPMELSSVVTDFERDFHERGVATLRAAYERTGKV